MKHSFRQTFLAIIVAVTAFMTSSCLSDDDPYADKVSEITITVKSETVFSYPFMGVNSESFPIEMLVVEEPGGRYTQVTTTEIEGFEWERGYEYRLRVRKTVLGLPPADGTDTIYKLLSIISKTKDDNYTNESDQ